MTMITPSYLGETIEYSSLHACRSTLEDPTSLAILFLCEAETPAPTMPRLWYSKLSYRLPSLFPARRCLRPPLPPLHRPRLKLQM